MSIERRKPSIPYTALASIVTNLSRRNTEAKASFGIANEAMAVRATTITTIVLTIPASTAD